MKFNDMGLKNKIKANVYNYILSQKVKLINNTCVFLFKSVNIKKNNSITIYAYCKHQFCKSFKFVLLPHNEDINVLLYSHGKNYCHGSNAINRPARGTERKLLENRLLLSKPSLIRSQDINNASSLLISHGHLDTIRSDSVYRKAKFQAMSKKDRDEDDLFDVIQMKRAYSDKSSFIFFVGEPFFIDFLSKEQLDIAVSILQKNCSDLHIDATGKVVRRPKNCDKTILYYAAVVQLPNGKPFSISDLISNHHDTGSIVRWLNDIKYYFKIDNK